MKGWFEIFFKRVPIIPNLLIAFGISYSSALLSAITTSKNAMYFSTLVIFIFLTELRLMDEIKDYDKDVIAHPERPLPKGLIPLNQYKIGVNLGMIIFFSLSIISFMHFNKLATLYLLITQVWLFLMYKEFFIHNWLEKRPLLYAISHQIVVFPLVLFSAHLNEILAPTLISSLSLAFLILSSFFTYEVCRKLDPKADPILGTYLIAYGPGKVMLLSSLLLIVGLIAINFLPIHKLFLISYGLSFLSIFLIKMAPLKFKAVEGIITIHLLLSLWILPITAYTIH